MIVALLGENEQETEGQYPQEHPNPCNPSNILLLALWSNMGHLNSHFFYGEETIQCREKLSHLLQLCSASQDQQHGIGDFQRSLTEEEYLVFVFNAFIMADFSTRAWAPAA
jgi:hypothetical protein